MKQLDSAIIKVKQLAIYVTANLIMMPTLVKCTDVILTILMNKIQFVYY